jgi:hypothetical protein
VQVVEPTGDSADKNEIDRSDCPQHEKLTAAIATSKKGLSYSGNRRVKLHAKSALQSVAMPNIGDLQASDLHLGQFHKSRACTMFATRGCASLTDYGVCET